MLPIERKEDLSIYYHLKRLFSGTKFIIIEDSFPEKPLEIPTVSVDAGTLDHEPFQLGDRSSLRIRKWYIDVFAKNKSQRDDISYTILGSLDDGIDVFDYDMGFPPSVSPTKIGHLALLKKSFTPVPVLVDKNEKLYYRGQVTIITQNDLI